MRLRNVAVAVAISLPTVGLGGSALADGDGPFKKIPISFTAGPPLPGGAPGGELTTDCTTGDACVAGFNFGTGGTVVGDFAGDYVEVFAFGTPEGGGASVVTGTGGFTGTVKRCGTGSFVWTEFGVAPCRRKLRINANDLPRVRHRRPGRHHRKLEAVVHLGQLERLGPLQGRRLTR